MGIFALNDIYIKIKIMNPISEKLQAIIDNILAEVRKTPEPVQLSSFFAENPDANYFSVVQRLSSGGDTEYDFKIVTANGNKVIQDVNKNTKTKGCVVDAHFDTMLYGEQFKLNFGQCGTMTINNVIGIRLYVDENAIKSGKWLDSYELDHDKDLNSTELVNHYYDILKNAQVGDEIYFDSKFKYDGEVSKVNPESMQMELLRAGSKSQPLVVLVDLTTNPFYDTDTQMMFKAKANKRGDWEVKDFVIPVKKVSTHKKEQPKQEPKKPEDKESEKKTDDELRSDGKIALDLILNDPNLKAAFYSQPSFLELLKAEISGKKAVGQGIVPTLNIVGNFQSRKIDQELGSEFKAGRKINFAVEKEVVIPYLDKKSITQRFVLEPNAKYNGKVKRYELSDGRTRRITNDPEGRPKDEFEMVVKGPTSKDNVYICDVIKVVVIGNQRKEYPMPDVLITFLPSEGYQPLQTKPEGKSQFQK